MKSNTEPTTVRIASMLASATEIAVALGLEDRLVAISHECDYPEHILDRPRASRPVFEVEGKDSGEIDRAVRQALLEVGSVYTVDANLLEQVQPTLILTQAVCDVCAVPTAGVREVVAEHELGADVLSLDAHMIADIFDTILAVGRAAGVETRAIEYVASLEARLEHIRNAVADRPRPRVLAIEWLDPPFLPGHWVPEMIDIAGGKNHAGEAGQRSLQTTWSDLAGLDPDVLLIMPCGFGLDASLRDADRFAEPLHRIAPRAIDQGHAFAVDGSSYFNRSGPRTIDGVEILARAFHNVQLQARSGVTLDFENAMRRWPVPA